MELHLDAGVRGEVAHGIAEEVDLERDLVVGLGVHEVILRVALVEELHVVLLERHALDLVFRAEPVLRLRAAAQVPELGLDHAAPVPGRHVNDVHHAPEVFVVLDGHAHAELRGRDQHGSKLSPGPRRRNERTDSRRRAHGLGAMTTSRARRSGPGLRTPCSSPAGAHTMHQHANTNHPPNHDKARQWYACLCGELQRRIEGSIVYSIHRELVTSVGWKGPGKCP